MMVNGKGKRMNDRGNGLEVNRDIHGDILFDRS